MQQLSPGQALFDKIVSAKLAREDQSADISRLRGVLKYALECLDRDGAASAAAVLNTQGRDALAATDR